MKNERLVQARAAHRLESLQRDVAPGYIRPILRSVATSKATPVCFARARLKIPIQVRQLDGNVSPCGILARIYSTPLSLSLSHLPPRNTALHTRPSPQCTWESRASPSLCEHCMPSCTSHIHEVQRSLARCPSPGLLLRYCGCSS
jgi:hypothetical protein